MKRVLVIKLAALGDMVQAFAPLAHIRAAHPEAEITLLTTPPYAALAAASPYVDRVESDGRPGTLSATLAMLLRLRRAGYDRVYDLQTSSRSSAYFYALGPKPPEWSGIAWGCSHSHANPQRDLMHTLERQADQLKFAGIWPDAPTAPGTAPPPDLSWMLADLAPERQPAHFGLGERFALLIPGASAHRPGKRWPAERYGEVANWLSGQGLDVGVIGGALEAEAAQAILAAAPRTKDLTGRTDFVQIAALGARAALALGNDTGPTHLVAAAGSPSLVLFSAESAPSLCAPRGRRTEVLQVTRLADLSAERVETIAQGLLNASPPSGAP
ncbi:MAG: glycosyltransferase family 9 protein [Caulobacteraceae bacterium]